MTNISASLNIIIGKWIDPYEVDSIRTGANKGLEDDENPDNVEFDVDIYNGFINGFLSETNDMLTPAERETLAFGPRLLTYEQAVRFLDDYIDGDKYYKCRDNYPQHNLVRARAQIKLLQSMEKTSLAIPIGVADAICSKLLA